MNGRAQGPVATLAALAAQSAWLAALPAILDTLLVQWTSQAVSPDLLAASFVLLAGILAPVAVLAAIPAVLLESALRPRFVPSRLVWSHFTLGATLTLLVYTLCRIRLAKTPLLDPAVLIALGLPVALGIGLVFASPRRARGGDTEGSATPPAIRELFLVLFAATATAVLWATVLAPGKAKLLSLLLLGGLFVASNLLAARAILRGSFPAPRFALVLALVAGSTLVAAATYPFAPGFSRAERLETGAGIARSAAAERLPSVMILVLDTVRADHLSAYGYERPTSPHLADFARGATLFARAFSSSNWSLPSHASLLTGLLPHEHGAHTVIGVAGADATRGRIGHRPLAAEHETLAETLARAGHRTGASVANYAWFSGEWGLLQGVEWARNGPRSLFSIEPLCAAFLRNAGIRPLLDWYSVRQAARPSADEIIAPALRWIDALGDEPFYLLMNFMDAHSPYTSELLAREVDEIAERFRGIEWPAENLRSYDLSIAFLDHALGALFDGLRARGRFDDTVIVVTSDHGETFGGEGRGWHGADLRASDIHVPLIVKLPRQRDGRRIERLAQGVDVVPTVLEAVGLAVPEGLWGSPLARSSRPVVAVSYLAMGGRHEPGAEIALDELDRELPTLWSLVEPERKTIVGSDGRVEVFDLRADPGETRNEAAADPEVAAEARRRLAAVLPAAAFDAHRAEGDAPEVSAEALERLRSLGYAQ